MRTASIEKKKINPSAPRAKARGLLRIDTESPAKGGAECIKKAKRLAELISKKTGQAMIDYNMLAENDKIAVAVSGGKDSLSLLKILKQRQKFVPIRHDIFAVHIDMGYPCQHPKILEKFFKENNIEYYIERVDILKDNNCHNHEIKDKRQNISCFWCSWNRRKAIFQTADKFGCNKVALGHHFDDIVETILLNLFFQGEISAMSPRQELFKGALTIIRPFAYIQESLIAQFAKDCKLPYSHCRCPNSDTSKRKLIKEMLKNLQRISPDIKKNVFNSIKRIKKDYLL
jgi:tRNA 2-thiocytidine biosynthesis protein TtcA